MDIHGKVALVTGGAHRVGKAITLMLAQAGAHVAINYHRSAAEAQQTASAVSALGVDCLPIQCDVANFSEVQQMAEQIESRWGGVDIIVNSASPFIKTPFPSANPAVLADWQVVTRTSIDGAYFVCNRLGPGMLARGGGAIVNIIDLSVWRPWRNFMAHAVAKAGLLAMTQQMALELAPTIRVNAVAPGPVLPPPNSSPQLLARPTDHTLLKRWGTPEDVAKAVRYLIEADYVTGDTIRVDGGELLC